MKDSNTSELIKEKARTLFFSHGPTNVSMDDIAKQSGVSKKTIYQFFNNKKAVVWAVAEDLIRSHEQQLTEAQATAHDALDEVFRQDAGYSEACKGLRPSF